MPSQTDSSLATRPSLLARLKDWTQQTAWREFDHDYAPLLRNVARKAGLDDAEAAEAVQQTLIAVAQKIEQFKHAGNRGSFRAWLYQQVRWRVADQFRARVRANVHTASGHFPPRGGRVAGGEAEPEGESAAGSNFSQESRAAALEVDPVFERLWDAEWEEHIRQSALVSVKRQVSARQFQLFDLHVLQGLPVRATAKAAGTTMASVYMAKSRVGRLLRRKVEALKVK